MSKNPKSEGLNDTFNNPMILFGSLYSAEASLWNVYDDISVQRAKNELILTRSEKNALEDAVSNILDAYMKISKIVDRRMKRVAIVGKGVNA